MTFAQCRNVLGETVKVERMEIHADANRHDYAVVKVAGNIIPKEEGWQENDPVRLTWGISRGTSSRSRTLMSREMVGYVAGPQIEHGDMNAFTEIHVLGATSVLQLLPLREEVWIKRSVVSVIQEILGRVQINLQVIGVPSVIRQLIIKPEEQTYWDFVVELADSVGASLHPINTTVLLIGHRENLLLAERVSETDRSGPNRFLFSVHASARAGRQRKRWEVRYNDMTTGLKRTLNHHHLPSYGTANDNLQAGTEQLASAVLDVGTVSYGEARERLIGLSYKNHRYVNADLRVILHAPFTAFSGSSLQVRTRQVGGPNARRIEERSVESGIWRVDKTTQVIDLQKKEQPYIMDLGLSRAGLGRQSTRGVGDARPLIEKSRKFVGRLHPSKGWAA